MHENKAVQKVIDEQHGGQREPIYRAMKIFREGSKGFGKDERAIYATIASTYERMAKVEAKEEDKKFLRDVDKSEFYKERLGENFKMLEPTEFEILGDLIKERDKIREASSKAMKLRLAGREAEAEEIEASIVGPARELEQKMNRWEDRRKLFTRYEKQANEFIKFMYGNRETAVKMYGSATGVAGPQRGR
ncbi:MAG: hypothetical protein AABW99_03755 [archaeon]